MRKMAQFKSYKDKRFEERWKKQTDKYLRCLDCPEKEMVKDKWTGNLMSQCKLNGKYCVSIDDCPKDGDDSG